MPLTKHRYLLIGLLSILLCWGSASSAQSIQGISATLEQGVDVVVHWRFTKAGTSPLKSVTATLNGTHLKDGSIQPYPGPKDQTAIMLLLDVSDRARSEQITRNKSSLLRLAGRADRPHHQVSIAVYADGPPRLLVPADANPATLVSMLVSYPPQDAPGQLGAALQSAFQALAALTVDRRGIFVLTDGHSAQPLNVDGLIATAKQAGIAVNFILSPSERSVDRGALAKLAGETGGFVIDQSNFEAFLENPFVLIDSGATKRFPLEVRERFFWQKDPVVTVLFQHEQGQFELSAPVTLPVAGAGATASHLWSAYPLAVAGAGGAFALAAGAGALMVFRRRQRSASPQPLPTTSPQEEDVQPALNDEDYPGPAPLPILARLEDIVSGASYPVRSAVAHIGRASTNEIVLADPTVSRLHAVLQQDGNGGFLIENRSDLNPTLVNHVAVGSAVLAEGDLIAFGTVTLRFNSVDAIAATPEHTDAA
ncbi:MAG TPA: FHA domain-containing protein [Microvirga sp.]|nr:FHA domain-containing protein [Microvirga sp.]